MVRKKLGFVVNHYDARNDIREMVQALSRQVDLVVLARQGSLNTSTIPQGVEVRFIRTRKSLVLKLWQNLFRVCGKIPKSENNFFVNEVFKLSKVRGWRFAYNLFMLRLRLWMPKFISINYLLDKIARYDETPLDDLDSFLLITEFSDIPLLGKICNAGKTAWAYLYSWDHPCKHTVMTDRVTGYLVWNEKLAQDMVSLQGLPPNRCKVVGATQLEVIDEFLKSDRSERLVKEPYFYYGCGVGLEIMAKQEAVLIEHLAEVIAQKFPDHKLVVRPYPMLAEVECFQKLKKYPIVVFDDEYRKDRKDRSLTRADILNRLKLQEQAVAFIHIGTTMGFEAAFLNVPVLFLDIQDIDYGVDKNSFFHLSKFIHQYHLEQYMISSHKNVVYHKNEVVSVLKECKEKRESLLEYNSYVASRTEVSGISEISNSILRLF